MRAFPAHPLQPVCYFLDGLVIGVHQRPVQVEQYGFYCVPIEHLPPSVSGVRRSVTGIVSILSRHSEAVNVTWHVGALQAALHCLGILLISHTQAGAPIDQVTYLGRL